MKKELISLSSHSSKYIISVILIQAGNFFLIPIYTRYLTPADYGIIALLTTMISLLSTLLLLGQHASIVRFYYDHKDKSEDFKKYTNSVVAFVLIFSFFICFFLSIGGEPLFLIIMPEVSFYPYILLTIWIVYLMLPNQISLNLLQAQKRSSEYTLISVAQFLTLSATTIIAIVFLNLGVLGKVESQLITGIFFAFLALFMLGKNYSTSFDFRMLLSSLKYGLPLVPHSIAGWVMQLSDRLLLNLFVSLSQVGIYSLGYQFGGLLSSLLTGINFAWVPFFMSLVTEDIQIAKKKISTITTYYIGILTFFSLGLVFFSPFALMVIATPKFFSAMPIITLIVFATFWRGIYYMSVNPLFHLKKTQYVASITITAAILNIGSNFILIPIYGIFGAAYATIICYMYTAVITQIISHHFFPIQYEYRRIGKILGFGVTIFLLSNITSSLSPIIIFTCNILLIMIFIFLFYKFILTNQERNEGLKLVKEGIQEIKQRVPFLE